jgi:hypothetical protein
VLGSSHARREISVPGDHYWHLHMHFISLIPTRLDEVSVENPRVHWWYSQTRQIFSNNMFRFYCFIIQMPLSRGLRFTRYMRSDNLSILSARGPFWRHHNISRLHVYERLADFGKHDVTASEIAKVALDNRGLSRDASLDAVATCRVWTKFASCLPVWEARLFSACFVSSTGALILLAVLSSCAHPGQVDHVL